METTTASAVTDAPQAQSLSLFQRMVAVFVRPAHAWGGLESRTQWWFPLVLMTLAVGLLTLVLYDRALVPMLADQYEQQIEAGRMTQQQYDEMMGQIASRTGKVFGTVQQMILWPVVCLLISLVIWFGTGFVLGTKFRFRHALEVTTWSSLLVLPSQLLGSILAWFRENMQGVHVGFGAFVPESDPPSKIQVALAFFLDAIGPLGLWPLIVAILGASALSGAPRKSVAWVLGSIYVGLSLFGAAMGAVFTPGS